jgi:hypothetical protein
VRRLLFAAVLTLCPTLAMADASIAGQWIADPGKGVEIVMDIIADGHWFSTTVQDGKVVAELAGTYQQSKTNDATGKLVFTPTSSKTTSEHGAAKVEEDEYALSRNGTELTLTTAGEPMKFAKQAFAK